VLLPRHARTPRAMVGVLKIQDRKMQDWKVTESGSGKVSYVRTVLRQQFFSHRSVSRDLAINGRTTDE